MVKLVSRGVARLLAVSLAVVTGLQAGPPRAYAHRDPGDCTEVIMPLSLSRTPQVAHLGQTVTFTAKVNNTGAGYCSLENVTVSITTPDGIVHAGPAGVSVPVGSTLTYEVTYVVRDVDLKGNQLTATASGTGTSHSGDVDDHPSAAPPVTVTVVPGGQVLTVCSVGAHGSVPAQLLVTGTTTDAPSGAIVVVNAGAGSATTATDAAGDWSATLPWTQPGGVYSVGGTVSFPVGNSGPFSRNVEIRSVAVGGGEAVTTNQKRPVIAGTSDAPAGTGVEVTIGAQTESATVQAGGSWSLTWPSDLQYGPYTVTAQIDPLTELCASDTQSLTVVNESPDAHPDAYSVVENTVLTVPAPGVLANDSDLNGDLLTAAKLNGPSHGTLTLNADGSLTYTPGAGFTGTDSFTYRAYDGLEYSEFTTVTITVTPANHPPEAGQHEYNTPEDTPLDIPAATGLLLDASDPEGSTLIPSLVSGPANGSVSINPDGSFTYTPALNFYGMDTFIYKVNDGQLDSNEAPVMITVDPVNDPPVAVNDSYTVAEDFSLNVPGPGVLGNDTDADNGAVLMALLVTGPAHGTLTLNSDGSFDYVPAPNFNGTDSFTYKANDGTADSNAATVTITVTPVDDPPVAVGDAYSMNGNTVLTIAAPGVKANDSDIDGEPLPGAAVVSAPAHGSVALNPDGSFSYTPAAGYVGTDSFVYVLSGTLGMSNEATVTITVNPVIPPPANRQPGAADDQYTVDEDTVLTVPARGVLQNDSDPDGDLLRAVLFSLTAHGTLTLQNDGSFTYTPAPGFHGMDSFTYRASDWLDSSAVVKVTINVRSVNDAPDAEDDQYTVEADAVLTVPAAGVLANDSDPDGDGLTATVQTGPAHGTLALSANGGFTYTPAAGFHGLDTFTYRAGDGTAASRPATVRITVREPAAPPVKPVLRGNVVDAVTGKPLAGVTVTLVPGMASQETAAPGAYTWEIAAAGDYQIKAVREGYLPYASATLHIARADVTFDFAMQPVHRRYILGYPDGTFKPEQSITRAEIAAIMARIVQPDKVELPLPPFGDVAEYHWARNYIAVVRQAGLMVGDPDGNFRPDAPVTRAELAAIISRFKGLNPLSVAAFSDTAGHWAEAAIAAMAKAGLVTGYPDSTFRPEALTTRAEAAVMINRMLGRGPLSGRQAPTWPDVPFAHWASGNVEEASSSHSATRDEASHERWTGDTGEMTW